MTDTTGGTVRYHRAEYLPDSEYPWALWFTDATTDGQRFRFTAAEGEVMGLTPPEPEPLVVTCNGTATNLTTDEVDDFMMLWADQNLYPSTSGRVSASIKLARLLRDARQDPQPASDENAPGSATPGEQGAGVTCTPAPDTDSDTIDFDALPIGTVLRDNWGELLLRRAGGWFEGDEDYFLNADDGPYAVVYQPAPLSPGERLRGLLAGRDDADELIAHPYRHQVSWLSIIGDAAHGGA